MRMRHLCGLLSAAVACLLAAPPGAQAQAGNPLHDPVCLDRCVHPIQYTTPDQEYQERARRYREESVEFYRRQQENTEREQGRERSRTTYGAIAYSPDSGDRGYSRNYGSRGEAESKAMRECGKNDCEIAAWFYNSCGALATDDDEEAWGGAQGADESKAQQNALARCTREGGKNCKVVATACSR